MTDSEHLVSPNTQDTVRAEHLLMAGCVTAEGFDGRLYEWRLSRALAGELPQMLGEVGRSTGVALPTVAGIAEWFVQQMAGESAAGIGMRQMAARAALEGLSAAQQLLEPGDESEIASMLAQRAQHLLDACPQDVQAPSGVRQRVQWGCDAGEVAFNAWRLALLSLFKSTGDAGKDAAEKAQAIRNIWMPSPGAAFPRWAKALGEALWIDVLLPRKRNPAALAMIVHERAVMPYVTRWTREEEKDGQRAIVYDGAGDVFVKVPVALEGVSRVFVERGIELLGSVTSHKLVRHQVVMAHRLKHEHSPDPRLLVFDGGYSELARQLGITGKKGTEEVRAIIEAMHHCPVRWREDEEPTRLLIREHRPATGQQRAELRLILGTLLMPEYVFTAKLSARGARLVPVLPLPPLVGRPNEHGAQATLSMLVIAHLRDNAPQLVTHGGAVVGQDEWERMASRARLPRSQLVRVVDRWVQDGTDEPAFLRRLEAGAGVAGRYALAERFAAAQAFMAEGGQRSITGAALGRRGAANRQAKLSRLANRK